MTSEQEPEGADLGAAHCKPSVLQYCKRPSTFKLPEETYRVHDNDAGPQARCVWMCSTIYPGLTQELEDQALEAGCRLLSCPVFGRPDAVKAGNALFVCAGDPAAKEQARSSIRNMPIGLGGP